MRPPAGATSAPGPARIELNGLVLAKSPAFHSTDIQKSPDLLEPGTRAAVAALIAEDEAARLAQLDDAA